MALPGFEKKLPQALSTAGSVKAISRPPTTMATMMARTVTTTELPSRMASSTTRLTRAAPDRRQSLAWTRRAPPALR